MNLTVDFKDEQEIYEIRVAIINKKLQEQRNLMWKIFMMVH